MRLLICGDREWSDKQTMRVWVRHYYEKYGDDLVIIHGACEGADLMAESLAKDYEIPYEGFPARWKKHRKAAGPIRNRVMARARLDEALAFHNRIEKSKGTKNMLFQLAQTGIKSQVVQTGDRP